MDRRYNLRPRVFGRVLAGNTSQHVSPQQYAPPAGVPPSSDVHSLTQALLSAEEDDLKLCSENTALKEGNKKLLNENKWLQSKLGRTLHMAKQEIQRLEEALKARKAGQDACKQREETVRENEKEISALQESLHAQTEKTERVQAIWTKESDKMSAVFENDLQKELALKKKKKQHFWGKKRQKHSSEDEEGAVSSAQTGQEEERSHSDSEVEEEGARPVQAGQH